LSEVLKLNPGYPQINEILAEAYYLRGAGRGNNGNLDGALADFTRTIEHKPDFTDAYRDRGVVYALQGNYDPAIVDLSEVLKLNPDYPQIKEILAEAYNNRGAAYAALGNHEAAIADYIRAVELNPGFAGAYYNRGLAHAALGNHEPAITDYTRAIELNPGYAEPYNNRGNVHAALGNHEPAITDYTRAIELNPGYAEAYNNRGLAHADLGNHEAAIADHTRAIELDPGFAGAYNNLGLAYADLGNYEAAVATYTRAIELDPGFAGAYNNLGLSHAALGNHEAAVAAYTRAIELDPDEAMIYNNLGLAHAVLGNHEAAIAGYTRAIELNPDYVLTYNNLGNAHADMGNHEAAIAGWEQFLTALETKGFTDTFSLSWAFAAALYRRFPYLPDALRRDAVLHTRAELTTRALALGIAKAEAARSGGAHGAALMAQVLYLYYAGVDFEAFSGSPSRAFEYSEALRSRGFLEQLAAEAALRLPGLDEGKRDRVRELLTLIEARQALLSSFAGRSLAGEYNAAYSRASEELAAAERELAVLDRELAAQNPRYGELRHPRPVDAETAQAFCGEDTAVLEYVLWDAEGYIPVRGNIAGGAIQDPPAVNSYCLVITKDDVIAVRLDPAFDYSGAVRSLRDKVFHKDEQDRIVLLDEPVFEAERNALYRALIAPALGHIPGNVKNILIVPDGSLAYLPFDILRETGDSPDLGETYRLSLSPSLSVSVQASLREDRGGERLLGFGGALYNGYYGVFADGTPMLWDELTFTAMEINGIRRYFNQSPQIFTGREASEARVKAMSADGRLAGYSVIHFACHGYFNPAEPEKSGILLSEISGQLGGDGEDGNLSIVEVMGLRLEARMVLLSACETGLGDGVRADGMLGGRVRADGMVGLARSFMTAGTRNVGVSLWKIDDQVTKDFMLQLYRNVREGGMSFREGYYQTRKAFRGDRWNSHPYYWAAFTMYE
jgi:tetratricopeptide (TPR) repeat protein/CHAT domain-containing protein